MTTSLRKVGTAAAVAVQAMGLGLGDDGRSLLRGALTLHAREAGAAAPHVATGPRVGITKAADLPYRFFEADAAGAPSPWVSAFRPGRPKARR